MSHAIAKVCAAINADDAVVRLDADEMREVIDALDERERSIGRERARVDTAQAEVARLRATGAPPGCEAPLTRRPLGFDAPRRQMHVCLHSPTLCLGW